VSGVDERATPPANDPVANGEDGRERIRQVVLDAGFDLAGFAPISAAKASLAWARTVVVTAIAAVDEAFDYQIFAAYGGHLRWHKFAYEILVATGYRAAASLAGMGVRAEPLVYDDSIAVIDLKEAARQAGLGTQGLNGLLITPQFGPRVRLGALFLDAELAPDRPIDDYPCASCTRCWGACPTRALGPDGLDRSRCLGEFAPDAAMVALQREMLRWLSPRTRRQCTGCVTSCPIGRVPVETFFTAP
jgi:epoxyqueuosine reductase QueG